MDLRMTTLRKLKARLLIDQLGLWVSGGDRTSSPAPNPLRID